MSESPVSESPVSESPVPPQRTILDFLNGNRVVQALYVAAKLGLADLLASGPRTVEDLAATTGAQADRLYRVLRAVASLGVFEETGARQFALTPLADALRTDHPESMRAFVIFRGEESYRAWSALLHGVMTGETPFNHVFGMGHFDYLAQHPEASAIFDQVMTGGSKRAAAAIAGGYDFGPARVVVDVGGGQGTVIAAVLRAHPHVRGILFDQPHVVAGAAAVLASAGVADRCATASGDFFAAVPPGGDLYLLRRIIHDWDDEHATTILRRCAEALAPGGKVLVVEGLIPPGNDPSPTKFLDVMMLVMNGGRERTAEEYHRLFRAAGLRPGRVLPLAEDITILEAEGDR